MQDANDFHRQSTQYLHVLLSSLEGDWEIMSFAQPAGLPTW